MSSGSVMGWCISGVGLTQKSFFIGCTLDVARHDLQLRVGAIPGLGRPQGWPLGNLGVNNLTRGLNGPC